MVTPSNIECCLLYRETVFSDKDQNMLMRMSIQSLAPGLQVETPVIDTFVSILNNEEMISTKPFKRHYFHTGMMVKAFNTQLQ